MEVRRGIPAPFGFLVDRAALGGYSLSPDVSGAGSSDDRFRPHTFYRLPLSAGAARLRRSAPDRGPRAATRKAGGVAAGCFRYLVVPHNAAAHDAGSSEDAG